MVAFIGRSHTSCHVLSDTVHLTILETTTTSKLVVIDTKA